MVIYKFPVTVGHGEFTIEMPENAMILDIQVQREERYEVAVLTPMIWVSCRRDVPLKTRKFRILFTGEDHEDEWIYLKTVQMASLVLHFFKIT
jgi:hypothetical protein